MSASRQLQSSRSQNMLACLFLEIQYIQRWILSKFRLGECLLTTVAGRGDNRQWITNHPSRQSWICKNFCNIYLIFLYLVFLLHDSINSEQWIATYQKYQYCGSCAFSLSFWCQSLQVHLLFMLPVYDSISNNQLHQRVTKNWGVPRWFHHHQWSTTSVYNWP